MLLCSHHRGLSGASRKLSTLDGHEGYPELRQRYQALVPSHQAILKIVIGYGLSQERGVIWGKVPSFHRGQLWRRGSAVHCQQQMLPAAGSEFPGPEGEIGRQMPASTTHRHRGQLTLTEHSLWARRCAK